jgi:hypothetical protein
MRSTFHPVGRCLLTLAVVCFLATQLILIAAPVQANGGAQSSNNTTAEGPFQILASADRDSARNTTKIPFTAYTPSGTTTYNVSAGAPPVAFDTTGFTEQSASVYAPRTDAYRKRLTTDIHVPYADDWVSNPDELRVVSAGNNTTRNITTGTGITYPVMNGYYALGQIEPRNGWLPTRNAVITEGDNPRVTNPVRVEVNRGEFLSYEARNGQALDEFTTNLNHSRIPSGSPTVNQWYDDGSGITVQSSFSNRSFTVVDDHWVGVARMSPGAYSDGQFILSPDGVSIFAPSDFWFTGPSDWERTIEDGCKVTRTVTVIRNGNLTTVQRTTYYDVRQWERWNLVDTDTNQDVSVGGSSARQTGSSRYQVSNPRSGTISASHEVEVTLRRTWGNSSHPQCTWSRSETLTPESTADHTAEASVSRPDELSITVHAVDRQRLNQIFVTVNGSQDLSGQPVGRIRLSTLASDKFETIYGPWRFYPVRLYDSIEERTPNGTEDLPGSFNQPVPSDHVPHMYRDFAALGNWSKKGPMLLTVTRREIGAWGTEPALPQDVVHRNNSAPFYNVYGGRTYMTDAEIRLLQANAEDIFGNDIDVSVERISYQEPQLDMQSDGKTVYVRLFDPNTGTGLGGRTLNLTGTDRSQVVTNATGWAVVTANTSFVSATFEGTPILRGSAPFYSGVRSNHYATIFALERSGNLYLWLGRMIHEALLVVEWLALLLFLTWYKLVFKPTDKHGAS